MTPILSAYVTTEPEVVDARLAVLPVGSFEQHGPHLPLVTDTLIAVAIANGISDRYGALQLPPVTFSCSHEHADFAGTVSVSATTLAAIVTDIAQSLDRQGIRRLLIVNGHGGNYVLGNIVQQAALVGGGIRIGLFPTREDWADARQAAGMVSDSHEDMHGGELEVSILLAAFPDAVREAGNKTTTRPTTVATCRSSGCRLIPRRESSVDHRWPRRRRAGPSWTISLVPPRMF